MATIRRLQPAQAAARGAAARAAATVSSKPAPRTRPTEVAVEHGKSFQTTSMSHRKQLLQETSSTDRILTRVFEDGEKPAYCRMGFGTTINMGDFNSLRIDVGVTLPCLPSEVDETLELAAEYCQKKLEDEEVLWLGASNKTKRK